MLLLLLIVIASRPFISSVAYPCADAVYSSLLLGTIVLWIARRGISFEWLRPLGFALALYTISIVISALTSGNRHASVEALYRYTQGIAAFIVVATLSPADKRRTIDAVLAAGIVVSLLALYQYCIGFRLLSGYMQKHGIEDSFALDYITRRRPFLPFVTPNALAGYTAMLIPLAFFSRRTRWMCIPLGVALAMTRSIGASFSLAIGVGLYLYFNAAPRKWFWWYLFSLALCLGLLVWERATMQGTHTQPLFSAVMRLDYWRETLGVIASRPLQGVGIGNFNLTFSRYAHNSYLQLWAETGALGIASFIWLVFAVLQTSQKNAIVAGLCVFLLHNIVDFTYYLPEVSVVWWVMLGLCMKANGEKSPAAVPYEGSRQG